VLADGEFYRVGGHTPIKVNVRVVAATHQNLEEHVKKGLFREDLFHRLNVIRIQLPSLRERREDIPALLNLFLKRAVKELEVENKILLPEVENYLSTLEWPGNVRQLENTCHWLAVMTSGSSIHLSDLPPELQTDINATSDTQTHSWQDGLLTWSQQQLAAGAEGIAESVIPDVEKILIKASLEKTGGRKNDAAHLLGWGRNTLTRKIKEYGVE
jgi:two-component system nitrogen regulation response regulator GlnG